MKRKLASYSFVLAAMTATAAYSVQEFGPPPGQKGPSMVQPGTYIPNANVIPNSAVYRSNPDSGWSQVNQPIPPSFVPPNHKNYLTIIDKDRSISFIEKEPGVAFTREEMEQSTQMRMELTSAIATIKSGDSDDALKKDSKQLVAQFLKAEFKRDQSIRRDQVERLEKQVEQLKKQLAKREESQDKLIELRMQLLENDASGLSFPDTWSSFTTGSVPTTLPMLPSALPNAPYQNQNPIYGPSPTNNYPGPYSPNLGVPQYPNPNGFPGQSNKAPTEAKKR